MENYEKLARIYGELYATFRFELERGKIERACAISQEMRGVLSAADCLGHSIIINKNIIEIIRDEDNEVVYRWLAKTIYR